MELAGLYFYIMDSMCAGTPESPPILARTKITEFCEKETRDRK